MTKRNTAPARKSISHIGQEHPFGINQGVRCLGLVQGLKTSLGGASKMSTIVSSRSPTLVKTSFLLGIFSLLAGMFLLLFFEFFQIIVEAIEALIKEPAIVRHPISDVLERTRLEPAGPPLRFTGARDQAGALEHLQVLGHGGKSP